MTVDTFAFEVPWSPTKSVLVHRRSHSGRHYVRIRAWLKHKTKSVWYPTKRGFVIPLDQAANLGEAIKAAAAGETTPKPDWLAAYEREQRARNPLLPPGA